MRVQSLIWEDPTCHRATEPVYHSYWVCAPEPGKCTTEPWHHERSHHNGCFTQLESSPCWPQLEKGPCSNEDPAQPKRKLLKKKCTMGLQQNTTVTNLTKIGKQRCLPRSAPGDIWGLSHYSPDTVVKISHFILSNNNSSKFELWKFLDEVAY